MVDYRSSSYKKYVSSGGKTTGGSTKTSVSNPSSGSGASFDAGSGKVGFASPGVTIYNADGSVKVDGSSNYYKPGISSSGSFQTAEGKTVTVETTPISETAQKERTKMLKQEGAKGTLTEKQNKELNVIRQEMFDKAYPKKEETPDKRINVDYGGLVVSDVAISPALAKKYKNEVLQQSINVSETEPTVLRVRRDTKNFGNLDVSVQQPKSIAPFLVKPSTGSVKPDTYENRIAKLKAQSQQLQETNPGAGMYVSSGLESFGMLVGEPINYFFNQPKEGLFDAKGNPVVSDSNFKPTVDAINYQNVAVGQSLNLGFFGAGASSVKPSPFKVSGVPVPKPSILKVFEKPFKTDFKTFPKGKVVEAKNMFSNENFVMNDKQSIIRKEALLSEKTRVTYPSREKVTFISPANEGGLQVSGIVEASNQLTLAKVKTPTAIYERVTYTDKGGVSQSDYFVTNRLRVQVGAGKQPKTLFEGNRRFVGSLQSEGTTPSVLYTEPVLGAKDTETIPGLNKITEIDYAKSIQKGVSNLPSSSKFEIESTLKSELKTVTKTEATNPGVGVIRRTEVDSFLGEPVVESVNIPTVKYSYGSESSLNEGNVLFKNKGSVVESNVVSPVVSETSQVTSMFQSGSLSFNKKPNIFQKLQNARVTFKPSPPQGEGVRLIFGKKTKMFSPPTGNQVKDFGGKKVITLDEMSISYGEARELNTPFAKGVNKPLSKDSLLAQELSIYQREKIDKPDLFKKVELKAEDVKPDLTYTNEKLAKLRETTIEPLKENKIINDQKSTPTTSIFSRESMFKRGAELSNDEEVINLVVQKPKTEVSFGEVKVFTPTNGLNGEFKFNQQNVFFAKLESKQDVKKSSEIYKPATTNKLVNSNVLVQSMDLKSDQMNVLKLRQAQDLGLTSKLTQVQKLRQTQSLGLTQKDVQVQKLVQTQVPALAQVTVQTQVLTQKRKQIFKPIQQVASPNVPPTIVTPKPIVFTLPKSNKNVGVAGFDVLVRKQGVFRRVNANALSQGDAISFGRRVVDFGSSASFKVVPSKSLASGSLSGSPPLKPSSQNQFYQKGNIFIEKNKYRINTGGELREITYKGISSSRGSRKFNSLFKGRVSINKNMFGGRLK